MSNLVAKFTQTEIAAAVAAVSLPAALQGTDEWSGSSAVGGNVASHLASANGKSQTIGLCQLFGDWWFGSDSLPNILKGIKNAKVRKAFDTAVADVVRNSKRGIAADEMLSFLKAFTCAALSAEQIDADKLIADTSKSESGKSESGKSESGKSESGKSESGKAENQADLLTAQAQTINDLQQEVERLRAVLNEQRSSIVAARTLKEVKALIAA